MITQDHSGEINGVHGGPATNVARRKRTGVKLKIAMDYVTRKLINLVKVDTNKMVAYFLIISLGPKKLVIAIFAMKLFFL